MTNTAEITQENIDPREIAKFDEVAFRWWDTESEFKPLHEINPLRLQFINNHAPLTGKTVLDVGCGGGILTEAMAKAGARVYGIDMGPGPIQVAKLHMLESNVNVKYEQISVEAFAEKYPAKFDIVTCMEMLEHVPDPVSVISSCAKLVKAEGDVFFSTLNRNAKSYAHAIIGAEYILKMLTPGTHDYKKFIKPSELSQWMRENALALNAIKGLSYNPITKNYAITSDVSINYMLHAYKR